MRILRKHVCAWVFALAGLAGQQSGLLASERTGDDLPGVFARAAAGQPLKVVAVGGSITQAGGGWIGGWLHAKFPQSAIAVYNAGMSGTGSALAMFRLERDVLAFQPDLVLYEFVVNDGGRMPEEIVWTVESAIRKIKSLPNPPAVVLLEMASRNRPAGDVPPQRRVSEHYRLLSVDLNTAVHRELKQSGRNWEAFFGDDVHPSPAGHEFYGQVIAKTLEPFFAAASVVQNLALPPILSAKPLIVDGQLAPLPLAEGWGQDYAVPGWWSRFFLGAMSCKTPGRVLSVPFRGTVAGLFYALDEKYGVLYASIDGNPPQEIRCNTRRGFGYTLLATDLSPQGHLLQVVVPEGAEGEAGVKLGYLLVGGGTGAQPELAAQEKPGVALAQLSYFVIRSGNWAWAGPYGDLSRKWYVGGAADDLTPLDTVYPPEQSSNLQQLRTSGTDKTWKTLAGNAAIMNLGELTKAKDRGVNYLCTVINSPHKQEVQAQLIIDYYGKVFLNGVLVLRVDQSRGGPGKPLIVTLPLVAGENLLMLKVQSGSMGNLAGVNLTGKFQPITCAAPFTTRE